MRVALKEFARKFPIPYGAARSLYRFVNPVRNEQYFLEKLSRGGKPVFFVQIGAHNGRTDDELYSHVLKHKWKGVLVEPVEYLFNELQENYKGVKGLSFEKKAIGAATGVRTFYSIRKSENALPSWYNQLGSFKKEVILKSKDLIPDLESLIVEQKVDCISVQDLIKAHQIARLDLLLIDTEGNDFEILDSVDLKAIKPKVIIYEHKHLSESDNRKCVRKLKGAGYQVLQIQNSNNTVAAR